MTQNDLTFAELFAGVGGLSMGLEQAGWRCTAHCEIEEFPRRVLAHHWPSVRLDGDVADVNGADYGGITLLSGGSPCQDLSVAGKRKGMTEGSGTRSALFYEQVRVWRESDAPYFLWENVLGAFSSNTGRDFAAVLSALVGAPLAVPDDGWRGAGVASGPAGVAAWRVLDAQYFGVPQRRRRVFVLCARAGGVDPAEVLALSESVRGDSPTRGTPREGAAADAPAGAGSCFPLDARQYRRGEKFTKSGRGGGDFSGAPGVGVGDDGDPSYTLGQVVPSVAVIPIQEVGRRETGTPMNGVGHGEPGDPMYTLQAGAQHGVVAFDTKGTEVQHDTELAPILRSMNNADSHANGGCQLGVVSCKPSHFTCDRDGAPSKVAFPLSADADRGDQEQIVVAFDDRNQEASEVHHTLRADGCGSRVSDFVFDARGNGDGKVVSTLPGDHCNRVSDFTPVVLSSAQVNAAQGRDLSPLLMSGPEQPIVFTKQAIGEYAELGVASTVAARDHKDATDIVVEPSAINISNGEPRLSPVMGTLQAREQAGGIGSGAQMNAGLSGRPRRLLPIECERLMGWPDGWTDVPDEKGKPASDSARYKACGNGVASPCAAWIGFRLRDAIELHGRS